MFNELKHFKRMNLNTEGTEKHVSLLWMNAVWMLDTAADSTKQIPALLILHHLSERTDLYVQGQIDVRGRTESWQQKFSWA